MNQVCSLYQPERRIFAPDDPFFEEGNRECVYKDKTVDEDIDFLMDKLDRVMIEEFACSVKGCKQKFESPLDFNRHFDMIHKFRCDYCNRNFPSNHLLSLHLQENHDALFQVQKEKGLAEYDCIVEGCTLKFGTEELRRKHVIKLHKYPANFRFNAVKRLHTKYKKEKKDKPVSDQMNIVNGRSSAMEVCLNHTAEKRNTNKKKTRNKKKAEMKMEVTENPNGETENQSLEIEPTIADLPPTALKKVDFKRQLPASFSFGRGIQKGFSRPPRK